MNLSGIRSIHLLLAYGLAAFPCTSLPANEWSGEGNNARWDNEANWTGNETPEPPDFAIFLSLPGQSQSIRVSPNTGLAGKEIDSGFDYEFRQGSWSVSLAGATVEVEGTGNVNVETNYAVEGPLAILHNGAGLFRLDSRVSSSNDGSLILGGSGEIEYTGRLQGDASLVLTGAGTRRISANLPQSLSLSVEGGVNTFEVQLPQSSEVSVTGGEVHFQEGIRHNSLLSLDGGTAHVGGELGRESQVSASGGATLLLAEDLEVGRETAIALGQGTTLSAAAGVEFGQNAAIHLDGATILAADDFDLDNLWVEGDSFFDFQKMPGHAHFDYMAGAGTLFVRGYDPQINSLSWSSVGAGFDPDEQIVILSIPEPTTGLLLLLALFLLLTARRQGSCG